MQDGLSGAWSGRYSYAGAGAASVPFNAWLTVEAGALSGETMEPNTFMPIPTDTLLAVVSGAVEGAEVSFVKRYTDFEQSPVHYSGTADAARLRITGEWHIRSLPRISGTFVMVREARRAKARALEREAT